MKKLSIFWMGLVLSNFLLAQAPQQTAETFFSQEPREFQPIKTSWADFDNQTGLAQLNAGSQYFGSSLAYLRRGSGRLLYGLNLDILSIASNNDYIANRFGTANLNQTSFLVPLWLTFKVRLNKNPYSKIAPYIIAGVGPTLALSYRETHGFFNTLTNLNSTFGGGGFIGGGFDIMSLKNMALSADVRYNVLRIDSPVTQNQNYDGVSFSIGFIRAFGL